MPQSTDTAPFVLKAGEPLIVTRDQILQAMEKFDQLEKPPVPNTQGEWFALENEHRYPPKWLLKRATDLFLKDFRGHEARATLRALGFDLKQVDNPPMANGEEDGEGVKPKERDLQSELRANIEQLEAKLKITGKEIIVDFGSCERGRIDITAEDRNGATVVIELKAGKAGRRAIGQILGYMGCLSSDNKPVRGILVAKEFSPQARAAARVVPDLQLKKYNFKFNFEIVGAG